MKIYVVHDVVFDKIGVLDVSDNPKERTVQKFTFFSNRSGCVHQIKMEADESPDWREVPASGDEVAELFGQDFLMQKSYDVRSWLNECQEGYYFRTPGPFRCEEYLIAFSSLEEAKRYFDLIHKIREMRESFADYLEILDVMRELPRPLNKEEEDLQANFIAVINAAQPETIGETVKYIATPKTNSHFFPSIELSDYLLVMFEYLDTQYYVKKLKNNEYHVVGSCGLRKLSEGRYRVLAEKHVRHFQSFRHKKAGKFYLPKYVFSVRETLENIKKLDESIVENWVIFDE